MTNKNINWDATAFFASLTETNKFAQTHNFVFAKVSGLDGIIKINNYLCSRISNSYSTFDGNTYYVQKVIHEAFNQTDLGQEAVPSMIESIIHSMILDNDHKFSEMLSRLSLPQKELLYAIAKEGRTQQITSMAFIKRHNLRSASSIQSAIKKLMEYHLVSTSLSVYYIDDQLMRLWLKL